MARGYLNARHKTGGAAAVNEYKVDTSQTIAAGDVVGLNGGVVERCTASSGITNLDILGVAAASKTSSGSGTGADFPTSLTDADLTDKVLVYDDLQNTVFETSVADVEQADVGANIGVIATAAVTIGSQTVSRESGTGTVAAGNTGKTFKLLGAVKRPGNALAVGNATVDCYVAVNL
jgi:hypothetical protein